MIAQTSCLLSGRNSSARRQPAAVSDWRKSLHALRSDRATHFDLLHLLPTVPQLHVAQAHQAKKQPRQRVLASQNGLCSRPTSKSSVGGLERAGNRRDLASPCGRAEMLRMVRRSGTGHQGACRYGQAIGPTMSRALKLGQNGEPSPCCGPCQLPRRRTASVI